MYARPSERGRESFHECAGALLVEMYVLSEGFLYVPTSTMNSIHSYFERLQHRRMMYTLLPSWPFHVRAPASDLVGHPGICQ